MLHGGICSLPFDGKIHIVVEDLTLDGRVQVGRHGYALFTHSKAGAVADSTVAMKRVEVRHFKYGGIYVGSGASVDLTQCYVHDNARGISVQEGGTVALRQVRCCNNGVGMQARQGQQQSTTNTTNTTNTTLSMKKVEEVMEEVVQRPAQIVIHDVWTIMQCLKTEFMAEAVMMCEKETKREWEWEREREGSDYTDKCRNREVDMDGEYGVTITSSNEKGHRLLCLLEQLKQQKKGATYNMLVKSNECISKRV